MNRRALLGSLGALLFSAGAAIGFGKLAAHQRAPARGKPGLVSLTPAITETLFTLGAGSQLLAVSDYCQLPAGVTLPRVGSSLTPNYEAIARLAPSLILSDGSAGAKQRELSAIASCEVLPWLTLAEVSGSIRRLGQLVSQGAAAGALASRLAERLSRQPASDAPRTLLLLGYDPDRPAELWFIRRNSLHGAALGAAGAQNAVARDVSGLPQLGVEELLRLDPDVVLILTPPGTTPERDQRLIAAFSALSPLRAVKERKVAVVHGTEAVGPSILELVDALASVLQKLPGPLPAPGPVE